jgi:hypothetical protein
MFRQRCVLYVTKCPSAVDWANKWQDSYMKEYYSVMKGTDVDAHSQSSYAVGRKTEYRFYGPIYVN